MWTPKVVAPKPSLERRGPLHGKPLRPVSGHRFELCVYTDDVDAAVAELRDAGVPVLAEPADQPWEERLAYVEDPDGNPVMITASLT